MRILLVISGSVAAYKSLELTRLAREHGHEVTGVLTSGGAKFITPMSVASLSGNQCYTDLWDLKDEAEMGHIRLSREADVILVAPASADILAKMTSGQCDDLATTLLLATNAPVYVAPSMNHHMWLHAATQRNVTQLKQDGITVIAPEEGSMACGETGIGRMATIDTILSQIEGTGTKNHRQRLKNKHILVTAGPTYEAIDPVRFIGNRSSGKQGYAIAEQCAREGAEVTLISGPTALADPAGVDVVRIESTGAMLKAAQKNIPVDVAICAAAVSDWKVSATHKDKLKKSELGSAPELRLIETPDILAWLSSESRPRPELVIGFAAETTDVKNFALAKRHSKGCDWILANNVSDDVFGSEENEILFISDQENESWPRMHKGAVAQRLCDKIAMHFEEGGSTKITAQKETKYA